MITTINTCGTYLREGVFGLYPLHPEQQREGGEADGGGVQIGVEVNKGSDREGNFVKRGGTLCSGTRGYPK